jgi:aminoglycoside 3-N-acetyltransferase I
MEIMIKQLTAADISNFKEMLLLFEDVFEMTDFKMPSDTYLQALLTRADFLAFAAIHRGIIVGGITAHVLHSYYYQSAEVYIYDLAIKTEHQRKGFGKMLLEAVKSYCKQNNYNAIFVQADEADQHALDFYRSTGGHAVKVVHYTYPAN